MKRRAHREASSTDGVYADDSYSDCGDKTRATECGDHDETDGGKEDDFNSDSDDERASTYIDCTNYVTLTGGVNCHKPSSNGGICPPPREQSLEL